MSNGQYKYVIQWFDSGYRYHSADYDTFDAAKAALDANREDSWTLVQIVKVER